MKPYRRGLLAGIVASIALAGAPGVSSQDRYPSKPIRIVVPFAAGGPGDILGRIVAAQLQEVLGQSVIVDNRPGANGEPGTEYVAKSAPDGYTILQVSTVQTISMALQERLRYDLLRDFDPVSYVFEAPLVLVTPGTAAQRTVPSLVAYAKTKPEGLSYGTGGVGTVGHLSAELFKRSTGISAVNVPYKGNGAAMSDLVGGRLDFYFATIAESVGHIKGGRLNALAVSSKTRSRVLPDVPTMGEAGFSNFTPVASWGFMVPRNTPAPIVRQLSDAIAKGVGAPAVQERLQTLGVASNIGGPDALASSIRSDLTTWGQVIKAANIRPE